MSTADHQETPIPDKLYFKIGEVCEITGVKQHVLRYWESEFRILAPQRAHSRQRLYRRGDVENILRIKRLLKEEGFTISGAKKLLARERKQGGARGVAPEGPQDGPQDRPQDSLPDSPEDGKSEGAKSEDLKPEDGQNDQPHPRRGGEVESHQSAAALGGAAAGQKQQDPAAVFSGIKEELLSLKKILDR